MKTFNVHLLADLPNGAYLPYTSGSLDEYDWANYGENKFLVKDGSVYSFHAAGSSEAIMQSPIFPTINTEHRQLNSPLFGACKVTRRLLTYLGKGRKFFFFKNDFLSKLNLVNRL